MDHPSCFILNRTPEYIISLEDKISIIESLGVDYLYLLDFNKAMSVMSKEEYFNFLLKFTSPKSITTGVKSRVLLIDDNYDLDGIAKSNVFKNNANYHSGKTIGRKDFKDMSELGARNGLDRLTHNFHAV